MKKIPFQTIMICGAVLTLLVAARCITTACMELYYGRPDWVSVILADPWFYVGVAAAALVGISAIATLIQSRKRKI